MSEPSDEISQTHLLFALTGAALMLTIGVFVFASTLIAPVWAVAGWWSGGSRPRCGRGRHGADRCSPPFSPPSASV